MPIPVKACEGRFSEEVVSVLGNSRDRSHWGTYTCEVCGATVGAVQDKGKWIPEQHWPSVKYPPRVKGNKTFEYSRFREAPAPSASMAESTSR